MTRTLQNSQYDHFLRPKFVNLPTRRVVLGYWDFGGVEDLSVTRKEGSVREERSGGVFDSSKRKAKGNRAGFAEIGSKRRGLGRNLNGAK